MAKISADYNKIRSAAGEFRNQSQRIKQLSDNINKIMRQIPLSTTYFTAAKTRMLLQCAAVNSIGAKYQKLSSALDEIETTYRDADSRALNGSNGVRSIEDQIRDSLKNGSKFIDDLFRDGSWLDWSHNTFRRNVDQFINDLFRNRNIPYTTSGADAMRNFLNPGFGIGVAAIVCPLAVLTGFVLTPKTVTESRTFNEVTGSNGLKLLRSGKGKLKGPFADQNKAAKDFLKGKHLYTDAPKYNSDSKKQGLYDPATASQYTDEELANRKSANEFMSREAELEIIGGNKEWTSKHYERNVSNEYGSIESEFKVNKREVHGGAGFGEYTYKDADGKTHHGTGVYVEAGGSYSAIEGEIKGRLGNENLGVYGKVEGKALSASGTIGGNVGVVDGKVQAYAGVNCEAVLVEGSVSGGVSIGGTDVGVKATGKVGFSAKANVGYKDGHIVVDAGLAVGVGGEISLDINIGDTLEKGKQVISDGLKNGGKAIKGAAEGAKEWISGWFR